eukprot:403340427
MTSNCCLPKINYKSSNLSVQKKDIKAQYKQYQPIDFYQATINKTGAKSSLCNPSSPKNKQNSNTQRTQHFQQSEVHGLISNDTQQMRVSKDFERGFQSGQSTTENTPGVITPTNQTKNQQSNLEFGDKASKNKNMRLGSWQQQARNQIVLSGNRLKSPDTINDKLCPKSLECYQETYQNNTSQKQIRKSIQIQQSPVMNLVQQQLELKIQDNVEFNRLKKSSRITNVGDFQKVIDKGIIKNFSGTKTLIFQQKDVLDYQLRPNNKNTIHRRAPSQNEKRLAKVRHQNKQSKMMMEIPKEFIDYRQNYQTQIKLNGNNQGNFSSKKLNNQTNSKNEGGQLQMTLSKQTLIQKIPESKISQKLQYLIDNGSTTNKLRDSKIQDNNSSKRDTHYQIQEYNQEVISSPKLYKSKANINNQLQSNIGSLLKNQEGKIMTKHASSVMIQQSSHLYNNTDVSTLVGIKIPYISHIMNTKNLTGKVQKRNNNQIQNYQNIKKSRWTTTCIQSNKNPCKANDFDNLLNISNCDSVSSKSAISSFRQSNSCEDDIE